MLKVNDRIRITGPPKGRMHPRTMEVYQRLAARRRPVRISCVTGVFAWFECRFRDADGLTYHTLAVAPGDDNWSMAT